MSGGLLPGVQFFLAAALLVAVATALLVAAVWPLLRTRLRRVAPAQRFRWLLALAAAPLLAGVGQGAVCVLPSLVSASWHELDHHGVAGGLGMGSDLGLSLGHPHSHGPHAHGAHTDGAHIKGPHQHGPGHACVSSPPAQAGSALAWLGTLAAALLLSTPLLSQLRQLRRHRRRLAALRQGTTERVLAGHGCVRLLDVDAALAYADGAGAGEAMRGAVVVSRGLLAGLDPAALGVVVAHERAHLDRGDPAWRGLGALLSGLHLPSVGASLRAELALASEQACDDVAAAQVGDRVQTAAAIVAAARLVRATRSPAPCPGFVGGKDTHACHTTARVEALLLPAHSAVGLAAGRAQVAGAALLAAALTHPLQHLAEGLAVLLGG